MAVTRTRARSGSDGAGPLSEPVSYVLCALADGPRHGYAILKDVEVLSEGRVNLGTGTLYGALQRMMEQGWIVRAKDPKPNPTDRKRVCYRITADGRRVLASEVSRLQVLMAAASLRTSPKEGLE